MLTRDVEADGIQQIENKLKYLQDIVSDRGHSGDGSVCMEGVTPVTQEHVRTISVRTAMLLRYLGLTSLYMLFLLF